METAGYVAFGTLNTPYKFTREGIAAWAAVMREVPNSRFMMVRWYDNSTMRCHHLVEEFKKHGIGGERVTFMVNEPGRHLPYYNYIDMTLDRSEEHTSELQSLMRISYAAFCCKQKQDNNTKIDTS